MSRSINYYTTCAHAQYTRAKSLPCSSITEDFSRARNLLLGAVDTVLAFANQGPSPQPGSYSQRPVTSVISGVARGGGGLRGLEHPLF